MPFANRPCEHIFWLMTSKGYYLPLLKNMVPKALRKALKASIFGIKIGEEGIHIQQRFKDVFLDIHKLNAYKHYFNFKSKFPLTYLFLLAQRAQISIMLEKEYSIAVPGILHLSNHLEQFDELDILEHFELIASMDVEYKESGSLHPIFSLEYFQKGKLVAKNTSHYLVKRKKKGTKSNSKREVPSIELDQECFEDQWTYDLNLSETYAQISDDHNPIHKSKWVAKRAGLDEPIMHGWYSVSKIAQVAEKLNPNAKSIIVQFQKAVLLPSTAIATLESAAHLSQRAFVLRDAENNLLINGSIS